MKPVNFSISLLLAVVLVSGCSLKQDEMRSVRIDFAPGFFSSGSGSDLLGGNELASPAYSVSDFQCFGIDVVGQGIPKNPDLSDDCSDATPHVYPGILAGTIPTSGGSIDLLVPAGPKRTFQLLGMQLSPGVTQCPDIRDVISGAVSGVFSGPPIVLGQTTADIIDDTDVTIVADPNTWSSTPACMGQGDGGGAGPYLQLTGSMTTPAGYCTEFHFTYMVGANPAPAPSAMAISVSLASGATLYTDVNCTQGASSSQSVPLPLNATNSGSFFFTSPTSGTYALSITLPAGVMGDTSRGIEVWSPASQITIASAYSSGTAGSCVGPFDLTLRDSSGIQSYTTSDLTVSLAASPYGGNFYAENTCTTAPVTQIIYPANTAHASFWFIPGTGVSSGSVTSITPTATGVSSASYSFTIN